MWTVAHFDTRDFLFFQSPNPFILLSFPFCHVFLLFGCHLPPSWALLFEDVCLLYLHTYTPYSPTLDTHEDDTSWPFWLLSSPHPNSSKHFFTDFRDPHLTSESSFVITVMAPEIKLEYALLQYSLPRFPAYCPLHTLHNCSPSVLMVHHSRNFLGTHLPFLLPSHSPVKTPTCLNICQHQRYQWQPGKRFRGLCSGPVAFKSGLQTPVEIIF